MVETDDDLDVFMAPEAFGQEVTFVSPITGGEGGFFAIFDEAHAIARPGTNTPDYVMPIMAGAARVSHVSYLMICKVSDFEASGLEHESALQIGGSEYTVADVGKAGRFATIALHKVA